MDLDPTTVSRWLESLVRHPEEIAEVFLEHRRELVLEWQDGKVEQVRALRGGGLAARWRNAEQERLAFVSRTDEEGAREAVRAVQMAIHRPPLPVKPSRDAAVPEEEPLREADRWAKRLSAFFGRHAPRHRFRFVLTETARRVIPAHAAASSFSRRLVSLEGTFTAASRRGDEVRAFSFHAPDAEAAADELRSALVLAAQPRESIVPCLEGEMDVVLARGCAAVLFHEILSHPLEAGGESPLSALDGARVTVANLEVRDDATRLDLFGGYERDDEGVQPRPVKLLDAGRLSGRLTDRTHAAPGPSNGHARRADPSDSPLIRGSNVLVAGGHATADEMARRLGSGLWIEQLDGGSVELTSGRFRLRFPRARRIRRGRMADEWGPGILIGEILTTLKSIDSGLGREVRPYRALGWCARGGQVVPVQGAAPDVLIRNLTVRSSS